MMFVSSFEELARTCVYFISQSPAAAYPFAAVTEHNEIVESATFMDLLNALNATQPDSTLCVLYRAEGGEWVEDGYYFTTEEEG